MRPREQLAEHGLSAEDWGGDTLFVDVSAVKGDGIDKLLDAILLQAELLELKANPNRRAMGNVIESGMEQGGPTATVLVRKGTSTVGDTVICGKHFGKARALINEDDQRMKTAGPSYAVKLLGLNGVPEAGDEFNSVDNEKAARELAEDRGDAAHKRKARRPRSRRHARKSVRPNRRHHRQGAQGDRQGRHPRLRRSHLRIPQ